MTRRWLADDGPLVLLADAHAAGWEGIWREAAAGDPEDEIERIAGRRMLMDAEVDAEHPRTDYARACAALAPSASVALVPYRGGVALALETSGQKAAVLPSRDGAIVAKWIYAPGETYAANVLAHVADAVLDWKETGVEWELPSRGARLHPAASRFGDGDVSIPVALPPGRYAVATAPFEPDEDSSFELIALRRR
ncbi:MAG TPA: hypothetical protein VIL20_00945 [Sandaracinaceae bacterium]